jgi:hypothetical protein
MLRMISKVLYILASLLFAGALVAYAQAQPSSNSGQKATALDGARNLIIQTIGAEKDTVAIVATEKVVTVERINSNMNGSSHGARNNEAMVIGPIVVQAIADKPEFNGILVIRVQYLRRSSQSSKVVDTIEYRKDASGSAQ